MIIIALVFLVLGIVFCKIGAESYHDWMLPLGIGLLLIAVIALLCYPVAIFDTNAKVKEFESVRVTIENARGEASDYELAAIQQRVVDANKWLASVRYYRSSWFFRAYVPRSVDKLVPIK